MKKLSLTVSAIALTSMLLSACGGNNGNNGNNGQSASASASDSPKPSASASAPASPASGGQVEIFSWWTGAGEEAGLKGLIGLFSAKYPEIEVINAAVAGGAGTNAKAVLASRMQGGDPPDAFQVHGGAELNTGWVAADKVIELNDLYESEGWKDKFPKDLIDLVSKDGKAYSVPVNIHRGNVAFYNKKIFDDNGLKAPTTFDEFFQVADALKAKGITPLALGDKEPWAATMVLENVLLGVLGADDYKKLWTNELSFDDAKVKQSLETFKKMLSYVNEDHAARNWQDAAQLVANGEAAMNIMGDWAKGYFTTDLKLEANTDFGWVPTPNTTGSFMVITDTFAIPKSSKNETNAKEWLKVLGSVEGQDVFNPLKGSIPARIDADISKYDVYGQSTIEDFKTAKLAPSMAHGSAAPEGFTTQANQVVNIFVTNGDVDQALKALKAAQSSSIK
ncbi:carbohydrate ABC transporter substrate-binding protein (CUT1 family) [Cohnella lupini]|uniref:Carbohydrate ABC transporter substrate-binding protein (CUT1 family) n=2 Tax=Cohnella lupini TaxID=1294267 RepID=A0A3D9IC98_9BACL|nr:ABC transporter substrate-binding protein [Cohnella lupini]RED59388.1 carbohydrate ABC transporter substrate-binding protein (CUT1 family) [Cohnella lupini]